MQMKGVRQKKVESEFMLSDAGIFKFVTFVQFFFLIYGIFGWLLEQLWLIIIEL